MGIYTHVILFGRYGYITIDDRILAFLSIIYATANDYMTIGQQIIFTVSR